MKDTGNVKQLHPCGNIFVCVLLLFFLRVNVRVRQFRTPKVGTTSELKRGKIMSRILKPEAVQPVNKNQDLEIFGDSSSRIRMSSKYKQNQGNQGE